MTRRKRSESVHGPRNRGVVISVVVHRLSLTHVISAITLSNISPLPYYHNLEVHAAIAIYCRLLSNRSLSRDSAVYKSELKTVQGHLSSLNSILCDNCD